MLIYLSNYLKYFVRFPVSWSVVTKHFCIYLLAEAEQLSLRLMSLAASCFIEKAFVMKIVIIDSK